MYFDPCSDGTVHIYVKLGIKNDGNRPKLLKNQQSNWHTIDKHLQIKLQNRLFTPRYHFLHSC